MRKIPSLTDQLQQELRRLYDEQNERGVEEVDPEYLANDVLKIIDPAGESPHLVSWAATLELRQLARAICARRQKQETMEVESGQSGLFGDMLQMRYPCDRHGRDVYVLRERMTRDEYEVNIARLTNEAVAKQRHSDALRAEMEIREANGDFDAAA